MAYHNIFILFLMENIKYVENNYLYSVQNLLKTFVFVNQDVIVSFV